MQSLHDEVKDYLNETLIPRVIAEDATVAAWQAQEDAHAEAESGRVLAEETRAANEQNRETAEAEREQIIAKVENLTVSSEALEYGEPASAEVTTNPETGGLNVHFGLPMGKNGADFLPVVEGDSPPTGIDAWIDPSVDAETGGGGSAGSGVVISPDEPTDEGADVWIDTDDEEGEFYNKAETEALVDKKIAAVPMGVTMELLWENPNPESDFGEQTINLDLTDANGVVIIYSANYRSLYFPRSMFNVAIDIHQWRGSVFGYRLTTVSDSGVHFKNGRDTNYNVDVPSIVKPVCIYKVKGVQ
jgi:hypothetical protein